MQNLATYFEKDLTKHPFFIYDIRSTENREPTWFFIKVHKLKNAEFKDMIKSGKNFDLQDFGEILDRGWGQPTTEAKEKIKSQYDIKLG